MAGIFDLGGLGGFDLGDLGGFNLTSPGGSWLDTGGFNLGGSSLPSPNQGGSWLDSLGGWAKTAAPIVDLAKTGVTTGLDIMRQSQMANYQRDLANYNKQRAAAEAAYNAQVADYLKQRQAWEGQLMGSFGEFQGQFGEALGNLQGQLGDAMSAAQNVLNQELAAAQPVLKQSQELLEPAVAALAKGEVPAEWQPLLDQAKQRARAAALQNMASAGQTGGEAAITEQIDQQAHSMLLQLASTMLGQGQQLGQQGQQFLGGALGAVGTQGQLATAAFDPIAREFAQIQQLLASMLGGFPPLSSPQGAPALPVA